MFTGIVEEIGKIKQVSAGKSYALKIEAQIVLQDVHQGDSIAVNGVCLTVTSFSKDTFTVDLAPETRKRTNLEQLHSGSPVNLERALLPTTRLGGHFVQGHVDGTAQIISVRQEANAMWFRFKADASIMCYIVAKGFVCLDGTSLTVVEANQDNFTITLVPFSQTHTILARKKVGEKVNVEVDILGKYVEKLITSADHPQKISDRFLAENGFF